MIATVDFHIDALESMQKYPQALYSIGNQKLLNEKRVSIVGSRRPNAYAREMTRYLAEKLSYAGVCIVSGGAIGVDAIAHKAAGAKNTIMVAATGLDKRYPAINKNLIAEIEQRGLILSQFCEGTPSTKYNFVLRNELVVALGEVLVVMYADLNSGTMRSVEYAQKMGKKIYVLAHRVGESQGTNALLAQKKAEAIYDIDAFVSTFANKALKNRTDMRNSPFIDFCRSNPSYDIAVAKFPSEVFEAELTGVIIVENGRVRLS